MTDWRAPLTAPLVTTLYKTAAKAHAAAVILGYWTNSLVRAVSLCEARKASSGSTVFGTGYLVGGHIADSPSTSLAVGQVGTVRVRPPHFVWGGRTCGWSGGQLGERRGRRGLSQLARVR
ncbi:hypothetical protein FHS42_006631 [Streptomyces zagrosensis]|uniref:Uncharacterized protein n=1 Tax=Streptomyces zagrosensis TaxID=1042984 RepID=A0A7W9QHW1_9ACTN|nr:hypothetical protein [Streptomyces zagrosensis]